jgi:hypothetical protein
LAPSISDGTKQTFDYDATGEDLVHSRVFQALTRVSAVAGPAVDFGVNVSEPHGIFGSMVRTAVSVGGTVAGAFVGGVACVSRTVVTEGIGAAARGAEIIGGGTAEGLGADYVNRKLLDD